MTTIKRSVLLPVPDRATVGFTADASELGWTPGRWPDALTLEGEPQEYRKTGNIREYGSLVAVVYETKDLSRWVKVYND